MQPDLLFTLTGAALLAVSAAQASENSPGFGFNVNPAFPRALAQINQSAYDDFGAFSGDPTDLEDEVATIFGRYFQTSLQMGTGILGGDLGAAYASGFLVNVKFIFYFDRIWASELGVGFGRHQGYYDELNTDVADVDMPITMNLVPVYLGFRFGFDQDRLQRGFATMNPYLSVNGEIIFRTESVAASAITTGLGVPNDVKYGALANVPTTAFGVNVGGGIEFDVYRKRLFLGVDLRYHLLVWSSGTELFGTLGRSGNYITLMGAATYNY